ncbi:MAG TPA: lysine--tRNA ligase, partial [Mycobacterium sp.]|nr:lysine--tRNA ligase [Mycobacterium sp.]
MTVTAARATSRFSWVPATAGWVVGIIATLSLLASVSPLVRWIIDVPREFVDNYLFNFPDTSFAWAFVLALLAAALAARKRIAWWILVLNLVFAVGWNVGDLATVETRFEAFGEVLGLVLHLAVIALLLLSYREFYARARRGALLRAAGVLVVGMAIGILLAW